MSKGRLKGWAHENASPEPHFVDNPVFDGPVSLVRSHSPTSVATDAAGYLTVTPKGVTKKARLWIGVGLLVALMLAVALGVIYGSDSDGDTPESTLGANSSGSVGVPGGAPVMPSPTASPTTVPVVVLDPASAIAVTPGVVRLVPSGPLELLRLLCTDTTTGTTRLAGRSYGGHPWETAPPARTMFDCNIVATGVPSVVYMSATANRSAANCSTTIATDPTMQWRIDTHDVSGSMVSARAAASRLLMQATWGPDRSSIDEVIAAGTASAWVRAQMNVSGTSHRAYLRTRANPQFPQAVDGNTVASIATGGARTSCTAGSRWVRFSLTTADIGRSITLVDGTTQFVSVVLQNVVRTAVPVTVFNALGTSLVWRVCSVEQSVGGAVVITNGTDCAGPVSTIANPPVEAPPASRIVLQTPDPARLVSFPVPVVDTFVLATGTSASELRCATAPLAGPLFAEVAGLHYFADQRVELLGNTLDRPAVTYTPHPLTPFSCPNVRKTFLNAHTCVTGVSSCVPVTFREQMVTLDAALLRQFYTVGGKLVYYVSGLQLRDSGFDYSPCSEGISRWVRQPRVNGCCWASCDVPEARDAIDARAYADVSTRFSVAMQAVQSNNDTRVVDLRLGGRPAYCVRRSSIGVVVPHGDMCWRHSHPNELSVYDFTTWATLHPGGPAVIGQFAANNSVELLFPPSHRMRRWSLNAIQSNQVHLLASKLGDAVDFATFPTSLQSEAMATLVGAGFETADMYAEVCGSPGEVANDPKTGFQFHFGLGDGTANGHLDQMTDRNGSSRNMAYHTHGSVWSNVVLKAPDQLRQRVAWALSQIFVINVAGVGNSVASEQYLTFYDIFVRNAFGSYRDVMKEVSFSPAMGRMLSFTNSKSVAASGRHPDENYAREIMQLFSVGLLMIHDNGTQIVDASGQPIQSYSIDDVQTLARAWTGFANAQHRGNIELVRSADSTNMVDPHVIVSAWRDHLPKKTPTGGYVGDKFPPCSELPPRAFLGPGARYRYLGSSAVPHLSTAYSAESSATDLDRTINLNLSTSQLAQALCRSGGGAIGSACRFKGEVTLAGSLACDGVECTVATPRVLRVVDFLGNRTIFFEYVQRACVEMTFFRGAVLIASQRGGSNATATPRPMCANPQTTAAVATCCDAQSTDSVCVSLYTGERVRYQVAMARCASIGRTLCNFTSVDSDAASFARCSRGSSDYFWNSASRPCQLSVQIASDGLVNLVDTIDGVARASAFQIDDASTFTVAWANDAFPTVANGNCSAVCTPHGSSCICPVDVDDTAVFTSAVPSAMDARRLLTVGAADPRTFPSGHYVQCAAPACAGQPGVSVFNAGSDTAMHLDLRTVFMLLPRPGSLQPVFLRNVLSVVQTTDLQHSFRNPPSFHPRFEHSIRDAEYETDALIDYLHSHQNTPPFVSTLLIQRLVTSNPSPRYVESVANAFKVGRFAHFGSGSRGDLAATVAAVLLDREARSSVLDHDPLVGKVREPLVKLMHMLRALEYFPEGTRANDDQVFLKDQMGQYPFHASSVFNFFQLDTTTSGPLRSAGLVAPEAPTTTGPDILSLLNSFLSTVAWGLSGCDLGISDNLVRNNGYSGCNSILYNRNIGTNPGGEVRANITLNFSTPSPSDVVAELDVLLTGGRLAVRSADVIARAFSRTASTRAGAAGGLRTAAALFVMSAEFNTLSMNNLTAAVRTPGVLSVIQDYDCAHPCGVLGQLGQTCSACSGQAKCCKLGDRQDRGSGPGFCNSTTEGCDRRYCCIGTGSAPPPPAPTAPDSGTGYKAIVYLFLSGGCDSWNVLVPHSNCSGGGYAEYERVRSDLALPLSSLLPVAANVRGTNSSQDCTTYGLHPSLPNLHRLYTQNDALFVANIGALAEPLTKAQYKDKDDLRERPPQLFAHNTQNKITQNLDGTDASRPNGVLGRAVDALRARGTACGMYSVSGPAVALEPARFAGYDVVSSRGVTQLSSMQRGLVSDMVNLSNVVSQSAFAETWSSRLVQALERSSSLGSAVENLNLTTRFQSCEDGTNPLACEFRLLAKLVHYSKLEQNNERDVFFVSHGGYDVHNDAIPGLATTLAQVDGAIAEFETEMRALGLWDSVVIVQASEFGRTLTSNGDGSDHGWAGNSFVAGGPVRGGQILGDFPSSLDHDGPQSIGRNGRILPSTSWEMVWNGVAQWFGVRVDDMDSVLPRRRRFPSWLTEADIFEAPTPPTPPPPTLRPTVSPTTSPSPPTLPQPSQAPTFALDPCATGHHLINLTNGELPGRPWCYQVNQALCGIAFIRRANQDNHARCAWDSGTARCTGLGGDFICEEATFSPTQVPT